MEATRNKRINQHQQRLLLIKRLQRHSTKAASSADQKAASAASNSNASAQAAPGKLVEITLNAKDFEYDKKVIHVKQGDKVKLTLNSDDDGGHGFALPAYQHKSSEKWKC